ncbi:MAG: hypothetical protein IPK67_00620 [Planctomycetes bacterium]|nr:hypothetical protein [Planctomycetota bacterium]
MNNRTTLAVVGAFALLFGVPAPAHGQAVNLDIGSFNPAPSNAYGGAPGQVGFWNNVTTVAATALSDTAGAATSVVLTSTSTNFNPFTFGFDNPLTTRDDELLLDGGCDGDVTLTFTGLANGFYDVYTYAFAPDLPGAFFTNVFVPGSLDPMQAVGGSDWTGIHLPGITFAQHRVLVTNASLQILVSVASGAATTNGVQLIPVNPTPVVHCSAKLNSLGCLPAIASSGTSSASATGGFLVTAANVRNRKPGILLYGIGGRTALPFQGGTLCVGGALKRSIVLDSGGTALPANDCSGVYSLDVNAFAAGTLGGSPASFLQDPGTIVNCQYWGRDDGFPAPDNTTLSNALEFVVGA